MGGEKHSGAIAGQLLLGAIFLLSVCGLVYELIAGALSSYLLGNSVAQFSLVIGLFLTSMGFGSYLSKYVRERLVCRLVWLETMVGICGGFTGLIGFATFSLGGPYIPVLVVMTIAVGTLVGLEIPLVIRILKEQANLRIALANIFTVDYAGALAASLLFPFFLLPQFGIVRSGLLVGMINLAVAALLYHRLLPRKQRGLPLFAVLVGSSLLMVSAFAGSQRLVSLLEDRLYSDRIIYVDSTQYQRLVITKNRSDIRLFLDGHLQFSSIDEYRYHETLVHPVMSAAPSRENVLILGGGDGLAAKLVLQYPDVKQVDLVDLDVAVTTVFRENSLLTKLSDNSLNDERVTIHNQDAMSFLEKSRASYNVVIIDLPDPGVIQLGKLYSRPFYNLVGRHLRPGGLFSCQCTSPFRSREAYWCIIHTIQAATSNRPETPFKARPYHTLVPTFGTWGFVIAGADVPETIHLDSGIATRYLSNELLPSLFLFPRDMAEVPTPINGLDNPVICHLYRAGYHKYLE